ncbi:DUF192 domain-containing protein [Candidatus Woesearchaeota archaeon]|nr:DUF192 domain-containing protein [Candidatus Woesearchaeota archaeon]
MIKNMTRNIVLSDEKKICKSIFSKAKGLMFTLKPKSLVFVNNSEAPSMIHMIFVFYPIDVLWLDKDRKVVHMERLAPFRVSKNINAQYIIELPKGSAKETAIGDEIEF